MPAAEIDELVMSRWSPQEAILLEIEPYHTAIMGLITVHGGAEGRELPSGEGEETVVTPDYRYHRYWMPPSLMNDGMFREEGGYLKAHPLDCLGMYTYEDHKHSAVMGGFRQPPGAK